MKAILLDGSHANDSAAERIRATLAAQLQTQGWDVEHIVLREKNIGNCGFSEAHHCTNVLAICETFARQAGFEWGGALALGGGQGIDGVPLAEAGGKTIPIRMSLELTPGALVQGQGIPEAARDMMASPVIPHWIYRLLGGLGWLQRAKRYGALKLLYRKPYLAPAR